MPKHTYTVKTDKGEYDIEVDVPDNQEPSTVASDEPSTYLGGALKGAKEGMLGGAKGFVKGLVPGAMAGVKDVLASPVTIIKEAINTIGGTANLLSDPVKTLTSAYESLKSTAGQVPEAIIKALDLAKQNPEAFGKMVGEVTGSAEVGLGTAAALPVGVRPVARQMGNLATQVGTKGAWPIRMMGAHQLGSGNPLGIATMAMPEMLKKGGSSLTSFGESDPAFVQQKLDQTLNQIKQPGSMVRMPARDAITTPKPSPIEDMGLESARAKQGGMRLGSLSPSTAPVKPAGGFGGASTPEEQAKLQAMLEKQQKLGLTIQSKPEVGIQPPPGKVIDPTNGTTITEEQRLQQLQGVREGARAQGGGIRLGPSPKLNEALQMPPNARITNVKPQGIEALRTQHGAREAGDIMKQAGVNPELSNLPRDPRTNTIRDISGGPAGLLPAEPMAEVDAMLAKLSPTGRRNYLESLRLKAPNAPMYNYAKAKIAQLEE